MANSIKLLSIFTENDPNFALVLLNTPLNPIQNQLKMLWSKSCIRAFIDGASNEIADADLQKCFIPNFISGDFDSIRPEILESYKNNKAVGVFHTNDQDETDYTKCLHVLQKEYPQSYNMNFIVSLYSNAGRLDQQISNLHSLFRVKDLFLGPVVLLSECSITILLSKGDHKLDVSTGLEGPTCALIPLGEPCVVTTTGLKWNLNSSMLDFKTLVSTSNAFDGSGVVMISCDKQLLWTMEYHLPSIKS